jgi:sucrose phosphorylase
VSAVHVLPFFPSTSDDGFSVVDFRAVDPELGVWEDLTGLARRAQLMVDLVLNHVSRESLWFIDFVAGRDPGQHYFIDLEPHTDTSAVVRPRTSPLLVPVHTYRGVRHVWATFSEDQIDLNLANPRVFLELARVLLFYLAQGARLVRLDAVAYLYKRLGTPCIHLPETHALVKALRLVSELAFDPAEDPVLLVSETNVPHEENIAYFGEGDEAHVVYQFALAPLTLHAFATGDPAPLRRWLAALSPPPEGCAFLNFLASHDGIGVRPAEGWLSQAQLDALVAHTHRQGGFVSMRALEGGGEAPYELNIALVDALGAGPGGEDDGFGPVRLAAAHALMLALQGIPAVYIHSLLATPNDLAGVERTGRTRSINRRSWDRDALEAHLAGACVRASWARLEALLRCRRKLAAFHPEAPQAVLDLGPGVVAFTRGTGRSRLLVLVNPTDQPQPVAALPGASGAPVLRDHLSDVPVDLRKPLAPYAYHWLAWP